MQATLPYPLLNPRTSNYGRHKWRSKTTQNHKLKTEITAARQQMLIYVPPHPLVKHWLAIARNAATPSSMFRGAIAELGRILLYEASKDFLKTVDATITTPLGESDVTFIDPTQPIKVVPILRSGLVLYEHAASIVPLMKTYHVGAKRNHETLQPSLYLNELPESFSPDDKIVIMDSLVATGGTMMLVLDEIINRGGKADNTYLLCAITSAPALKTISEKYPQIKMYTGIIDPVLNSHGYIVPGVGDSGDRAYGTNS